MLESIKSYATISVTTDKYKAYRDDNGKTKLAPENDKEKLTFVFDKDGLEYIIFRDKGNTVNIDNKIMCFNMDKGKLAYIYFKQKEHVWMIKDPEPFMDDCKKAYVMIANNEASINLFNRDDDYMTGFYNESELPDEFDFDD